MSPPPRPLAHLAALAHAYPTAWQQAAAFRGERGRGLPDWPAWCYLPMAGAYAIVSGGSAEPIDPVHALDISRVAALAAWRETQGIYVLSLPRTVAGAALHGWYAHLERDANDGREELRLLLDQTLADGTEILAPIALHLQGDLREAVARFVQEALQQMRRHPRLSDAEAQILAGHVESGRVEREVLAVEPLVSVLLYLCTTAGEILARGTGAPHPRLRAVASRRPKAPLTWDVGVRLGSALAIAQAQAEHEGRASEGGHASPRGHIRRAHWATYWTGHRSRPQRALLRWLPPIPINLDLGGIVPTVHEVS